jgi:hypothetical protein
VTATTFSGISPTDGESFLHCIPLNKPLVDLKIATIRALHPQYRDQKEFAHACRLTDVSNCKALSWACSPVTTRQDVRFFPRVGCRLWFALAVRIAEHRIQVFMHDLFAQLVEEGEAAIESLKVQRMQEDVQLEFKCKANPNNGELTKDDRRNLGITLSALSNSMGGILIWGVVAGKNEDGIDCAVDLKPIAQIEKFKSEIERSVSQALMPRHDGIQIWRIDCSSAPGSGYLVIQVTRSERRPHRNEFGEKQYFKRIGDSSIAMEHYDIEDSFKRITVPSLDIEISLSDGGRRSGSDGDFATVQATLSLINHSQVSARYPYLILDEAYRINTLAESSGRFSGGSDDVIHPDLKLKALDLQREFRIRKTYPKAEGFLAKGTLQPPMTIKFRCGCLDSRPTSGILQITEKEVADALGITIA